jgi:hypothetical protein
MSGGSINEVGPVQTPLAPRVTAHDVSHASHVLSTASQGTSATSLHLSVLSETVVKLAALEGQSPDQVKVQAGRMARSLETLVAQQTGMAAMNARMLLERLVLAERTGSLHEPESSDEAPTPATSSHTGKNA